MNSKEKRYYEKFQSENISEEDLQKGKRKANKLGDLANDFLMLIAMVKDTASGDFKLSGIELVTIIGAIIYVVSPIDAIPDLIPLAGFTDDVSVVGIVLSQVASALQRYKNR